MASNKDLRLLRTMANLVLDADQEAVDGFLKPFKEGLIKQAMKRLVVDDTTGRFMLPAIDWQTWRSVFIPEHVEIGQRNRSYVRLYRVSTESDTLGLVKDQRETKRTSLYLVKKETIDGNAVFSLVKAIVFVDSKSKRTAFLELGIDATKIPSVPEIFIEEDIWDNWLDGQRKAQSPISFSVPKEANKSK